MEKCRKVLFIFPLFRNITQPSCIAFCAFAASKISPPPQFGRVATGPLEVAYVTRGPLGVVSWRQTNNRLIDISACTFINFKIKTIHSLFSTRITI